MLEMLGLKEKTAIELKYVGNSHQEISDKIGTPKATIDNWFTSVGKLRSDFDMYVKKMNKAKDKTALTGVIESDENIAKLTTNIIRSYAQQLNASGKRFMLVDKDNKPIIDKDGKPTVIQFSKTVTAGDIEKAWKIQRVITNRNTDKLEVGLYDKEEIEDMMDKARGLFRARPDEEENNPKQDEDSTINGGKN